VRAAETNQGASLQLVTYLHILPIAFSILLIAFSMVISSKYSMSLSTGAPMPVRVIFHLSC